MTKDFYKKKSFKNNQPKKSAAFKVKQSFIENCSVCVCGEELSFTSTKK